MTLTASTLASGIQALTIGDSEAGTIGDLADAFASYMQESTLAGGPGTGILALAPRTLMVSAMAGIHAQGAAAAKLAAGIQAYWNGITGIEATCWTVPPAAGVAVPGSLVVPPGVLAGLSATIQSVLDANLAAERALAAAASSLADAINGACVGGIVSVQPSVGAPIPQTIL